MVRGLKQKIFIFLFAFQTLVVPYLFGQGIDKLKAIWIVQNLSPNVEWSNEQSFSKFTIGVFGNSTQVYEELVEYSKTTKIKDKPFTVVRFRRLKDITYTQILYVEPSSNGDVKSIFENLKYNTLLITDQSNDNEYSMLNLFDLVKDKKKFEINKKNANEFGIGFLKNILVHGGDEVELRDLYSQTIIELQREKRKLEQQKAELSKQTDELSKLKRENQRERDENDKQKKLNNQQKQEIENRQSEIDEQRRHLSQVQEDIAVQQEKLDFNNRILETQEQKYKTQQEEVQKRKDEIQRQLAEIEKNKRIIESKDTVLNEQTFQIHFQRIVLGIFIALIVLIIVLAFYIWRGYKIKQKINDELRVKNIAINKQKEEILNQHKQTDLLNKELEKLSIVAAKTDNAVTIMDDKGNLEWVNVGYTRLYGFTLQLLTHEVDENIIGISKHDDIKKILARCVENKKTEVFESKNKTRNGDEIWVQTSLTPILDVEGNISKLITVETDISAIKDAESEIRIQHDKILEQTQQLEATNKELEKLSLVASETDNAISIMDPAGNYQWVNEGFSRLFGYSFNQLISEYSRNIITKDTTPEVVQLIKKSIEQRVPVSYELMQSTREGKEIWVQTTLTPIVDKEKNVRSLISITSDISKLKRAEQAIRQQSEELLAQKEELIYQKDKIELQNQNIRASISYAKTIQTAILPPESSLNKFFETFVIYRPKDIVSGDFYWYSYLPASNGRNEMMFYAAVDCTGHGVPGAFMSMIGSGLLNEIVNEKKIIQPSRILDLMNDEVKAILRQEQTDNNDGMDVCLCQLEHVYNGTTKLTFAGAKRPLYYYKNNESALKYIKGTRKTIGGTRAKRNTEVFQDHEVLLEKGDVFYLSTDGIVDQPSPERIRFGSLRFINLLKNIGNLPIYAQKDAVEAAVFNYQDHEQQRDDVTFLGIRV